MRAFASARAVWLPATALRELLDFKLAAPHPAALCRPPGGVPVFAAEPVAPEQLLGVYPNPQNEGLGLAHHFLLVRLSAAVVAPPPPNGAAG